jgi:DNA-binding MarR family transcriptional regulator
VRANKPNYVQIAEFRSALRHFERAAEEAARDAGLTPQRYLLLLTVLGAPDGSERATVNALAQRLSLAPHTITGAVGRAEEAGLLTREPCEQDRRRTWIRATPEGERRLAAAVASLQSQRNRLLAAMEHVAAEARAIGVSPGDHDVTST